MGNPRRRKSMNELARKLSLVNGDVLIIKAGTGLASKENIERLTDSLGRMGYYKTLVIVLDELDEITVLDEAGMNAHGWYRKVAEKEEQSEPEEEQDQLSTEEG